MITKNVQLEKLGEKLEKNLNAKFTKKDVAKIYDLVGEVIEEGILEGGVKIGKLFTVTVAERAARQGRNPQTGEKLSIPAKKGIKKPCRQSCSWVVSKNYVLKKSVGFQWWKNAWGSTDE